jgi:hypothetical protein
MKNKKTRGSAKGPITRRTKKDEAPGIPGPKPKRDFCPLCYEWFDAVEDPYHREACADSLKA